MFQSKEIAQKFRNVRTAGKHIIFQRYIVSSEQGDVAEILTYENEIYILLDDFPGQKKSYKYDFPIEDAEQFKRDMSRIGLELKWKHTLCHFCDKIKDCEGGIVCNDCENHE